MQEKCGQKQVYSNTAAEVRSAECQSPGLWNPTSESLFYRPQGSPAPYRSAQQEVSGGEEQSFICPLPIARVTT